ncbi:MAG: glycosyltransferase family 39 protein [Proteobacteria bacterium]|nr:glycosyltransferase family 39 protein [Pseudomonadota bacterium]
MTDSVVDDRRGWAGMRPGADRMVAVACFGLACAIGLVFAFVGLDTHSLWFDELFTARLLEPSPGTTLFARIATDVHPPIYLFMLSGVTWLFGNGETGLRLLSAAAACGAIVVFVLGSRAVFSLPARLFAAAVATGSLFWFNQAQNARSYALCLLVVSGLLVVGLALLNADRRRRLLLAALVGLAVTGSFTHFYALYVSLSVLILLGWIGRRDRLVLATATIALVLAAGLYVKLVIEAHTRVSLDDNWYQNNLAWYLAVLRSCLDYTLGPQGLAAILLCLAAMLHGRRGSAGRTTPLQPDRLTLFLAGVPLFVLAGAIVGSTLLAPNFWDRNFLVVSPFFWALAARAYDAAIEKAKPALRLALASALSLLVLSMAAVAMARLPSGEPRVLYEPFRQSAQWIQTLPACRGQVLPVVTTDHPSWYKPGYAEMIYESAYGRYLESFAPTQLVFSRDLARGTLPSSLTEELERRLAGEGCPVLAWSVHNMTPETFGWIRAKLLASLGRAADDPRVMTQPFSDGAQGYVLYIRHSTP